MKSGFKEHLSKIENLVKNQKFKNRKNENLAKIFLLRIRHIKLVTKNAHFFVCDVTYTEQKKNIFFTKEKEEKEEN